MKNSKEILLHPNDHKRTDDWISIFNFLDTYLPYKEINSSLDLGCGRGDISYHIFQKNKNGKAIGIDVDLSLLQEAKNRENKIEILNFDINQKLPFKNESMDLVSSIGTLPYPYITSFENTFSEMVRVSKKYIIVDFLYKFRLWPLLLGLKYPKYSPKRYTDSQIKYFFKKYNLKIVGKFGTRSFFGSILPSFGRITIFILEK